MSAMVTSAYGAESGTVVDPDQAVLASGPLAGLLADRGADPWAPSVSIAQTDFGEFDSDDRDIVSASRAAAYSLILPGAGQWYVGARQRAGAFLAADAVIWSVWGYFRAVGDSKEDDHQNFAQLHAGVNPTGKNDEFYRTLTFFESRDQFNETRSGFRQPLPNTAEWDWQWDSDASRQQYRRLRNQSNESYNRAKFSVGALALNRVVAALDAWRTARSVNRRSRMEMAEWKVRIKGRASLQHPKFKLIISKRF